MRVISQALVSIWSYRLVRVTLGALFIWAAVVKLMDPEVFAVTIDGFGLLPKPLVGLAALGLPILELAAAVGLILDTRGCLAVITGLLVMFSFILAYGLWLGLDIDCGCYGPGDPEAEAFSSLKSSLNRDLIMLAGVVYMYWWRRRGGWEKQDPPKFGQAKRILQLRRG
ncbi:hypothetical protein AAU61_03555 [Desulfocarbo indianensis]|nr:hypothetical protein AAU61_03555 [Desulfocarbo indianensis]